MIPLIVCCVLCTVFSLVASAQSNVQEPAKGTSRMSIGLVAGATSNTFSSSTKIPADTNHGTGAVYENQSALGWLIGVDVGLPLSTDPSWTRSLDLRLAYSTSHMDLISTNVSLPSLDSDGDTVYSTIDQSGSVSYSVLDLAPSLIIGIGNTPFSVSIGGSFGLILTSTMTESAHLVYPLNASFDPTFCPECEISSDGRTSVKPDSDIEGVATVIASAFAGVEYLLALEDVEFLSTLRYRLGLTDISSTYAMRVNALELSIAMRVYL
ncbi:MAG TPA: hypothetical protein VK147_12520 [Candidatus Didemnitutus sp.]|nr:hypothetical protein [Candidatus Didemnitutus sp.]